MIIDKRGEIRKKKEKFEYNKLQHQWCYVSMVASSKWKQSRILIQYAVFVYMNDVPVVLIDYFEKLLTLIIGMLSFYLTYDPPRSLAHRNTFSSLFCFFTVASTIVSS